MSETEIAGALGGAQTSAKSAYLQREKSISLQEKLKQQEAAKQSVEVRSRAQQLGKDDFLKLLITQLSYQDPTSPLQDQQFIAQMAQFSSLEQMQNMSSSLGRLADRQAHNLLGRYVIGKDFANGGTVRGIAQALFYDAAGTPFLKVQGRAVALDAIELVSDPSMIQKQYGGLGDNKNRADYAQGGQAQTMPAPAAPEAQRGSAEAYMKKAKQSYQINESKVSAKDQASKLPVQDAKLEAGKESNHTEVRNTGGQEQ